MKKPDVIKKGLEHCSEDGCKKCPYEDDCNMADGFSVLAADALALIQQLEAENAQKDRCIENLTDKLNALIEEETQMKAENGLLVEVRHGRWVKKHGMMPPEYHHRHVCSVCNVFALHEINGREQWSFYCPNCGAKMDAKEE